MLYAIYMAHTTITIEVDPRKAMKRAAWLAKVADERDRRRPFRAQTIGNKRAQANKKAARRKGGWD